MEHFINAWCIKCCFILRHKNVTMSHNHNILSTILLAWWWLRVFTHSFYTNVLPYFAAFIWKYLACFVQPRKVILKMNCSAETGCGNPALQRYNGTKESAGMNEDDLIPQRPRVNFINKLASNFYAWKCYGEWMVLNFYITGVARLFFLRAKFHEDIALRAAKIDLFFLT